MTPVRGYRLDKAERPISAMKLSQDLDIFKVLDALAYPLQSHRRDKRLAADLRARINQPALARRLRLAVFDVVDVVPRIFGRADGPGVHGPIEQSRGARALVQETVNAVVDRPKVDLPFGREVVLNNRRVGPDAITVF